jgi:hypothetical protein
MYVEKPVGKRVVLLLYGQQATAAVRIALRFSSEKIRSVSGLLTKSSGIV